MVDNDDRRACKERMRKKAMERVEAGLKRLQARVYNGRLKKPEKIGAAAARLLQPQKVDGKRGRYLPKL